MMNEHSCNSLATTDNAILPFSQTVTASRGIEARAHAFGTTIPRFISTHILCVPQLDITISSSCLEY